MDLRDIERVAARHEMEPVAKPSCRSAVLIPLIEKNSALHLLFEVRNAAIRQGGEVCFPGGLVEAGERPEQAAVRETCEELLVNERQVTLLAPMFQTARGNLQILSYLGTVSGYEGSFSPDEVSRTFLLPLDFFLQNEPEVHTGRLEVRPDEGFPYELIPFGRDYPFAAETRRFYFYRTPHGVVWGLTAAILYHTIQFLKNAS